MTKKRYYHIRVKPKGEFDPETFRTHDIGRKGHSKRIAGKFKKTGKWGTQKYLISRADFVKGDLATLKLVTTIHEKFPKAKLKSVS